MSKGNGNTDGTGSSKEARPSAEQGKARRQPKGKNVDKKHQRLSIPEAGNRRHCVWVVEQVMKLQLENDDQKSFVQLMTTVYANLTLEEVKKADVSRLGLTFKKVQSRLGEKHVRQLRKDWEKAKRAFVAIVHERSFSVCCDEVAAERRANWEKAQARTEASRTEVAITVADIVGTDGLATLQRQLKQDLQPTS